MNIQHNISLKAHNTFGMDVCAASFISVNNTEMLQQILEDHKLTKEGILVLGGGSNLLFTRNCNELVLHNQINGIDKIKEDNDHVWIKAGAGVPWHQLVMHCIEQDWAGLENLALIPGSVGASPMQNIGAYGVEIKDVFYSLEAYHIHDNNKVLFTAADCNFGYRESVFKRKYKGQFIITSVTYKLQKQPIFHTEYGAISNELDKMGVENLTIRNIAEAVMRIRRSKLPDPAVVGNAGSFFKNPEIETAKFLELKSNYPEMVGYRINEKNTKVAAGWLIESCGWKGFRRGDAGCHPHQALVLVNYGAATGNDIVQLSEDIVQSVAEKFNINLEREVNIY